MLGKLKSIVSSKPKEREGGGPEMRKHTRYLLSALPIGVLRFADSRANQICDISFGGIGLIDESQEIPPRTGAKLSVLNRAVEVEVKYCHRSHGIVGLEFVQLNDGAKDFLDIVNNSLKIGKTLELEKKWENKNDKNVDVLQFKSESEFCSAEIVTHNEDDHLELDQLTMNFPEGKSKCTLTYNNGDLKFESSGPDPFKTCINETAKKKRQKAIIRKALLMLVGTRSVEQKAYIRCAVEKMASFI